MCAATKSSVDFLEKRIITLILALATVRAAKARSSGDLRQRKATAIQRADKKTYKSFYGKEEKEKINLD